MIVLKALIFLGVMSVSFGKVPDSERNALVDYYNSLDGPNWRSPHNWLTGDPCDNFWEGIRCHEEGKTVSQIISARQFLNGTIPMSLANLVNLTQISLSQNSNLQGPIPPFYQGFTQLWKFQMFQNGISGDLPSQLGNISSLTLLNLSLNHFSGTIPEDMFGAAEYIIVDLSQNRLTGTIPDSVCKGPATLQNLRFEMNRLSGTLPDCFLSQPNLKNLQFGGNAFTGTIPTAFSKLATLIDLTLWDNKLTGELPSAFLSTSLEELSFRGNSFSGTIPDYSQNFFEGGFTYLYASNNQLEGTIPDWICDLSIFTGENNNFTCPFPSCCGHSAFKCGEGC
mmetsp:Transcript_17040/g.23631  ORF Transcript_17040/g.23631 Transcript_17040/m.23631 type:complete len:338 (+) Transcript_17040:664-1677(+)